MKGTKKVSKTGSPTIVNDMSNAKYDKCKIENTETSVKDLYSYIMFILLF